LERERRQTRLIASIAIGLIVIIIGLIGYGILNETILKAHQPVVTVNGESYSLHEFQVRVRVQRQQLINQYMQYYEFAQLYGIDPSTDTSLSQTLNQIQDQLDSPTQIGSQVISDMQNDLLIRQYAKANGIIVSEADVEKSIQDAFGYYPDGSPTPSPTTTPIIYSTLNATQYALMTPTWTATSIPPATMAAIPSPEMTATATSVPSPLATATATSIPSITPTATPYTLEGFQNSYQDSLSYYAKLGLNEADFRKLFFESPLYKQKVSDIITADVPHEEEEVWARHILVTDETTAITVRDQLLAGADFSALAAQYSTDTGTKDQGGDLGWFGKGKMVPEFETAAFTLQIGEISQPVQSTYGWHIIQVLGHEMRPLTNTEYTDAVNTAFSQWLTDQANGAKIVTASNWSDNAPNLPDLQTAFDEMFATSTAYFSQITPEATPTP
jgi:peptidyl-prolyl cis-trans isomerase D